MACDKCFEDAPSTRLHLHGEMGPTYLKCDGAFQHDPTGIAVAYCGHVQIPADGGYRDAETFLIDQYLQYGTEFVSRLAGSFALVLVDSRQGRVLLARDAAGTVPLYVYRGRDQKVVFATRIKDMVSSIPEPRLNGRALLDFLTFFWALDGKTFFQGVELLPQGSVYVDGRIQNYFTFIHEPEHRTPEAWSEAILDALRNAVARCMEPGVGCHLSGGIDSSLMAVLLTQLGEHPPRAYVASFPEFTTYDEAPFGEAVAHTLNAPFVRVPVGADDVAANFTQMLKAIEEPKCHPPVIARFLMDQVAARDGCRTIVTGRGADEIFSGYDTHMAKNFAGHRSRRSVMGPLERSKVLKLDFLNTQDYEPEVTYDALFKSFKETDTLGRILALDFHTIMMNWLVLDYKISSWFQIRPLAPFLDTQVIDLARRIPTDVKCPDDRPKGLLKQTVVGLLPSAIVNRKKVGFRTPMGEMMRAHLEPFVRDMLARDNSIFWDYFKEDGVTEVIESHFSGQTNQGWQLWAFLCVKEWLRIFVESEEWKV